MQWEFGFKLLGNKVTICSLGKKEKSFIMGDLWKLWVYLVAWSYLIYYFSQVAKWIRPKSQTVVLLRQPDAHTYTHCCA